MCATSVSSATAAPPLDGTLHLHEFVDFHSLHNPNRTIYTWKGQDGRAEGLSYLEFARAVHRAARAVDYLSHETPVGVVASSDTITYHAVFLGLMKAGYVPYLLSPRNSAVATAKLLRDVNCRTVLASAVTLKALLDATALELEKHKITISVHEFPSTQQLYPNLGATSVDTPFENYVYAGPRPALTDDAYYLHSSGSTSLPKTIPQTHLANIQWATFQSVGDIRLHRPELRIGASMLPSFHTLGLYFQVYVPLVAVRVINVAPPVCPAPGAMPFTASPANALDHARATHCNSVASLPVIIEMWGADPASLEIMQGMEVVWWSGGSMPAHVGDKLVEQGVHISSIYGGTEFGAPVHSIARKEDIANGDWAHNRFDSRVAVEWISHGDGLFEPRFLANDAHALSAHNMPGRRGYSTTDLFQRHPTKDLWKIVGRADDVIVLSSGEKLVPIPAEDLINKSPLVAMSMLFGREQSSVGVIVEPVEAIAAGDETAVAAYRDSIMSIIDEANQLNPSWARIFPHMIVVTEASKPLVRSAKGSLQRKVSLATFEKEIAAIYQDPEDSGVIVSDVQPLSPDVTDAELKSWLIQQATEVLGRNVHLHDDLFEQGYDSLTLTTLRARILVGAKDVEKLQAGVITLEWMYQHPCLSTIAQVLLGGDTHNISITEMLEKYKPLVTPYSLSPTTAQSTGPKTVLLTGSTGALGSRLLHDLLKDSTTGVLYCINRPTTSSASLLDRHYAAFDKQGLDKDLLLSPKLRLLTGDIASPQLGLDAATIHEIRTSPSLRIIHNAWRVDFNLTLSSFEPQVKGTANLLNLATSCSDFRGFVFVSSMNSAQAWDKAEDVPEAPVDERMARGPGYGESKYVAERLVEYSGLPSVCLRVGQISGGRPSGAWSTTEWFPILVKTSLSLGAFPKFTGTVSWIPLDELSKRTVDVALADSAMQPGRVLNVLHPQPVHWDDITAWIKSAIEKDDLQLLSTKEWLTLLGKHREDAGKMDSLPALKLLPFFEAIGIHERPDGEIGGLPGYATSEFVEGARRIDLADARKWMDYWRQTGFIQG